MLYTYCWQKCVGVIFPFLWFDFLALSHLSKISPNTLFYKGKIDSFLGFPGSSSGKESTLLCKEAPFPYTLSVA